VLAAHVPAAIAALINSGLHLHGAEPIANVVSQDDIAVWHTHRRQRGYEAVAKQ